ncbi:MAG: DUF433 domain-containing protein [Candidatus Bipolaricaulota bacterium]|nr:DUF433 domain-containing protein [Candidatus Bipolaricaulota bacterium]
MVKIADRIEVEPKIHHGKPVIAGTRVPVHMILGLLGNNVPFDDIRQDYYDNITKEDILACIRYANSLVQEKEVYAIGSVDGRDQR